VAELIDYSSMFYISLNLYSNMDYKVVKYRKKKKCSLDTYEPKKRIGINKENTLPLLFRIGHELVYLGGLMGFWISGILMGIKGIFGFKTKMDRFGSNKRVVELRIQKN
jgi:hypothetical protein